MSLRVLAPGGDWVCVTERPFRSIKGNGICALPFCGMNIDTYHDSELCYYHRLVALGIMQPEVDKFYTPEVKGILKGARI